MMQVECLSGGRPDGLRFFLLNTKTDYIHIFGPRRWHFCGKLHTSPPTRQLFENTPPPSHHYCKASGAAWSGDRYARNGKKKLGN